MHRRIAVALMVLLLAAGPAAPTAGAAQRWHLGVTATTDYVQRGVSQSAGDPALQAALLYHHPLAEQAGVYAGAWASSISSARGTRRGIAGNYELNLLLGLGRSWDERWDVDVALARYLYFGGRVPVDYDYTELLVSVGHASGLRLTATASPDTRLFTYRGLSDGHWAYSAEVLAEHALGTRVRAFAGVGYYELRGSVGAGYAYHSAGLVAPLGDFEVELMHVATQGGGERLFGRGLAGARFVFSVVKGF